MDPSDNAVIILLHKPALDFVRKVRHKLDVDPTYLDHDTNELTETVAAYLIEGGLLWDNSILAREAIPMLKQAITQLRLIEK